MKDIFLYKLSRLKKILRQMDSVLVAYSGGVDSTLLLKVSKDILGDRVLAVTALSETYPKKEIDSAKKIVKDLGLKHLIIRTNELSDRSFKLNPVNRCYYCKKELFGKLRDIAQKNKIDYILDGSNCDDIYDFRPGNIAKKEFKVYSPLAQAGFKKADIRRLSRRFGLSTWDKPALACLASRISYGKRITKDKLQRIDNAERFIRSLGFKVVRVRDYGDLARIEIEKKMIPVLINKHSLIITDYLRKIGYSYVTLDLEGYRMGSMNSVLPVNR